MCETHSEPSGPVIGYVLKMYPRFSETFIVSEILAREAAGERIVIFSLRTPTDTRFHAELGAVRAPVIQLPRTSSATRMWQQFGEAGEHPQLRPGLDRALGELLEHDADDAFQSVLLARAAIEAGVTHLHAHFASVATSVARLAALVTGLPYSFTAHAKDIFHEEVQPALLERKLAQAHHAVTISQYNLDHLRTLFPRATERLHLVRNGLPLERFPYEPGSEGPADPAGPPRILAVGRLVEKKGFSLLIEAIAELRGRGVAVQADIVGDGPLAADLQAQVAALALQDTVHLLGPRTQAEVNDMLGTHDVFAAPFVIGADGNTDGLPTVLLEAMARGIRCVAADVTAVGEVIRSGESRRSGPAQQEATGWLVPSGDVSALVQALTEALQPADHSAITEAARALVAEQFSSHRQAVQLAALVAADQLRHPASGIEPAGPAPAERAAVSTETAGPAETAVSAENRVAQEEVLL